MLEKMQIKKAAVFAAAFFIITIGITNGSPHHKLLLPLPLLLRS